jgi:1-acyl-sn-glycerol-3-phosphate acyltransferase
MIRSSLVYTFMALYILVLAPPTLVWTAITGRTGLLYTLSRLCVRIAGIIAGVKVRVSGREKLIPGETYVFLPNHQGNCDAPVAAHAIPCNFVALVKKEMMKVPLLSRILKAAGFVPIDRLDAARAHASIDRAAVLLKEGRSFLVFPEGTRSRDGRLGEFKKGAFIMAIKAQKPVVPITILNSFAVNPSGSYKINPGIVEVIFHDPIPTVGMNIEERDSLIAATRNSIASAM